MLVRRSYRPSKLPGPQLVTVGHEGGCRGKESKTKLWERSHTVGWGQRESNAGQKLTEIYREAPGKQDPALESLLDRRDIGQAPACDGSL